MLDHAARVLAYGMCLIQMLIEGALEVTVQHMLLMSRTPSDLGHQDR